MAAPAPIHAGNGGNELLGDKARSGLEAISEAPNTHRHRPMGEHWEEVQVLRTPVRDHEARTRPQQLPPIHVGNAGDKTITAATATTLCSAWRQRPSFSIPPRVRFERRHHHRFRATYLRLENASQWDGGRHADCKRLRSARRRRAAPHHLQHDDRRADLRLQWQCCLRRRPVAKLAQTSRSPTRISWWCIAPAGWFRAISGRGAVLATAFLFRSPGSKQPADINGVWLGTTSTLHRIKRSITAPGRGTSPRPGRSSRARNDQSAVMCRAD